MLWQFRLVEIAPTVSDPIDTKELLIVLALRTERAISSTGPIPKECSILCGA